MLREIVRGNEKCDKDLLKETLRRELGPTDGKCSLSEFVRCLTSEPSPGISKLDATFIGYLCSDPPGGSDVGIAKFIGNMDATSPSDPYAEQDRTAASMKS